MKTKLLILIIITTLLSAISCGDKTDCMGDIDGIITNEEIYITIENKQGENIFINDFYLDSLIIFENDHLINFDNSNNIIKFKLSDDFYKHTENISGDEIITNIYFKLDNNTSDTVIIETTPKYYSDECDRTAFYNTKVYYKSNLVYENADGILLLYTTYSKPLALIRPKI